MEYWARCDSNPLNAKGEAFLSPVDVGRATDKGVSGFGSPMLRWLVSPWLYDRCNGEEKWNRSDLDNRTVDWREARLSGGVIAASDGAAMKFNGRAIWPNLRK